MNETSIYCIFNVSKATLKYILALQQVQVHGKQNRYASSIVFLVLDILLGFLLEGFTLLHYMYYNLENFLCFLA
jgi:hypothetical protein